eukprot:Nitzschia sp. Nitz4//scaffold61_size107673//28299//31553//NITZ4_004228-RA/size107673-snap-gene-0.43-mRNA-1//1//CDS//3329555689//8716//frame0
MPTTTSSTPPSEHNTKTKLMASKPSDGSLDLTNKANNPGDMESTIIATAEKSSPPKDSSAKEATILCELVGARNLVVRQDSENKKARKVRPYCIVHFGENFVHKTRTAVERGCDPIWTATTGSLFLLQASPVDLFEKSVRITIHSKIDMTITSGILGTEDLFLGQVLLDCSTILSRCNEERFEVALDDSTGGNSSFLGTLALRFRMATSSDKAIVSLFDAQNSPSMQEQLRSLVLKSEAREKPREIVTLATETAETEVATTSFVNALQNVFTSNKVHDKETGSHKVRIKPYPDPNRVEETKFLLPEDILLETHRPSQRWVEAGSGKLGKLYCEVLSCHDLPNVDIGEAVGNVTDSFVCLVYEDTCAMTEVIDDELSPHWLPWTQRAFCFGMMHPASVLYLGVFDYDLGTIHEPLGRVAVNISNLQRNVTNTLRYALFASSNVTDRTPIGSITIRLRVECHDEKQALLAALKPRPKIFVNVTKEKSFKVVRYTCFGEYDGEEKFDLTVTRSYINEIFEYKAFLSYAIGDTLRSLIFWRGQVEVCSVMIPLHSFLFFCMAVDFIERPYMFVPYTLICWAWIMLANLTMRRQHPSPWTTCPSFWHFLYILWAGNSPTQGTNIKAFESAERAKAYEEAWANRRKDDLRMAEERLKLQEELMKIGDDNISTKTPQSAIPLDLLERLSRWQGIIGRYCGYFRFIRVIVTWEESVVSFWITAGLLGGGIVLMLLPWRFILTWVSRIVVWGFLGPHMKLVDLCIRASSKQDRKLEELVQNFNIQSKLARLRREEALKAKDLKTITFGKYSVQVPSFNLARHFDRPLPESSAQIDMTFRPEKLRYAGWIPGQQLFGVMIPRPEDDCQHQEEEHQKLLEKLPELQKDVVRMDEEPESEMQHVQSYHSFGYEVIPDDYDSETDHDDASSYHGPRTLAVVMSQDEIDPAKALDGHGSVVLEVSGDFVYEVQPNNDEPLVEEEGLEVVGIGRYGTLMDDMELEQTILQTESSDAVLQCNDSCLATKYKTSRTVDIAFYRPDKDESDESIASN